MATCCDNTASCCRGDAWIARDETEMGGARHLKDKKA